VGGVGKTELAVQAGLVTADTTTPIAVDAVHRHLRSHPRWLLIFDNANSRDDLAAGLPSGSGHLIITSRNPVWTGVAEPIDVDVFTRPESTTLLLSHLTGITTAEADRLADSLGDLPLAVAQAADLISETRFPIDSYLAELRTHTAELLRSGRPPVGCPAPLGAAVTVAAHRLSDDNPAAGQLLTLSAHLAPDSLPASAGREPPAHAWRGLQPCRPPRRPAGASTSTGARHGHFGAAAADPGRGPSAHP
jgi:hypothetical protein